MTYDLPPRPDPQTGEPRPPAAPTTKWGSTGDRDKSSRVPPKAFQPAGRGRVLEYERTGGKDALKLFGWGMLIYVVFFCIMWAVGGENPFAWMRLWYAWLIGILIFTPFAWVNFNKVISAGADWVSNGKDYWVDIYDLKSVEMSFTGTNYYLKLRDQSGHVCDLKLYNLEWAPRLWDLVYNGILHCYANGTAKVDDMAKGVLKLDSILEQYETQG